MNQTFTVADDAVFLKMCRHWRDQLFVAGDRLQLLRYYTRDDVSDRDIFDEHIWPQVHIMPGIGRWDREAFWGVFARLYGLERG